MMNKHIWILTFFLISFISFSIGSAQSLAEKKAALRTPETGLDEDSENFLLQINKETKEINEKIQGLYKEIWRLYRNQVPVEDYKYLLVEINEEKRYLNHLQETWREMSSRGSQGDSYGLWHAPDTTLEELIVDYGSQDYVYLIPPEVGGIRLSINSHLPIPRASWTEMLETILSENGVGVKELNPYLRELYLLSENHSNLRVLTNRRQDLEVLPPNARVGFVLSPEPSKIHETFLSLEKFISNQTTFMQVIGRDILVMGKVEDIQDLLKLYDFFTTNRGDKEYRLIPVSKIRVDEMARIIEALFDQPDAVNQSSGINVSGLRVIILQNMTQALFVIGTNEEIRKAEEIVRNTENSIGGARDRVVHWYMVKHSNAEELATVLYKVYGLMMATGAYFDNSFGGPPSGLSQINSNNSQNKVVVIDNPPGPGFLPPPPPLLPPPLQKEPPATLYGQEGFYQEGGYVVNPAPSQPRIFLPTETNSDRDNFIVDMKTGAIVMVVEADALPQIKELLRKLDVPKKMVQIETLLFEKTLCRQNSFGLNLLRIGDLATQKNLAGAVFNNIFPVGAEAVLPGNAGVTEFFLSRKKTCSGIPAFDLVYRFLLNQDDIQINSNPSVMTVNQVPATISINEDISINTGIFEVETAKGVTLKDAFTRAQYGITISIKPTIHTNGCGEDNDYDYVTLETDVTFDTIQGGNPSRPNVIRRHISNEVEVPDGETVVLGGLRRKVCNDSREAIPFLGELPGLGKLFSINTLNDTSTEMFIFITPRIVKDPKEQLACLRQELLCLRPGDVPYFLECVEEANRYEKTRLMEGSMAFLFGRPKERYYMVDSCPDDCGEYDGR